MPDIAEFLQSFRAAGALRAAAPLLAVALLAGCGPREEKFAPACPALKLLPDASDLVRNSGQGTDITDLIVRGRIIEVPASCKDGGRSTVAAEIKVGFEVTRGPAARDNKTNLPYLVTVMQGDRIVDQKPFAVSVVFPPNVDQVNVFGDPVNLLFPVSPKQGAADYTIYVSFRLTPEELAYNRRTRR